MFAKGGGGMPRSNIITKSDKSWQGGRGVQKAPKICWRHMWMAPFLQKFFLFQFWITFVLTISLKGFVGRCKTNVNLEIFFWHFVVMSSASGAECWQRGAENHSIKTNNFHQQSVKEIFPNWHWFYNFQQILSKKL